MFVFIVRSLVGVIRGNIFRAVTGLFGRCGFGNGLFNRCGVGSLVFGGFFDRRLVNGKGGRCALFYRTCRITIGDQRIGIRGFRLDHIHTGDRGSIAFAVCFRQSDILGLHSIIALDLFGLGARTRAAATGAFGFFFFLFLCFRIGHFFGQKRLAVRDRNLVIIRMDFGECKEPVAIAAVIHKSRLKRRFDARYFCEIDVASKLAFVFRFKIEFLDLVSVHHHDAGFFRVGGVDEHFLCH